LSASDRPSCPAAVVTVAKVDHGAAHAAFLDASGAGPRVPADVVAALGAEPEAPPRPLAKVAGAEVLAKVERERDGALAKLAEVRRDRDRLQKAARVQIAKLGVARTQLLMVPPARRSPR
jgi:hypothetical protein